MATVIAVSVFNADSLMGCWTPARMGQDIDHQASRMPFSVTKSYFLN
jgi:hypothetical protein